MPSIDLEKCTGCLKCEKDCPASAITIKTGEIAASCIHCGHCVAICPEMAVSPDRGVIVPLKQQTVQPEDFRNLSAGIRSCRSFLSKEIPDDILMQLIENMKHYPSASNGRQLKVTIVRTAEKVGLLNDMTEDTLIKKLSFFTSPIVRPVIRVLKPSLDFNRLRRYRDSMVVRKKMKDSSVCHNAPAVILFHGPASETGMLEADANIWATNTSVYANTMGLASCFVGFVVQAMGKNSRQNSSFGIPSNHRVYASLLVGFPKVRYQNETSREHPEVAFL